MEQPLIVQAEYSFKGGNNDELCFKKGDLITVTQREEGGWWEGTLNDKTGWFPSNYVNEYKTPLPLSETIRPPEEIQEYRSVVLKDLLDSERAHVAEVQGLLENFLEPLQQTQILTVDEYAQLMCNFVEVVKMHEELLSNMEECNDRVGKLFLTKAPHMKQVHQAYCAAHPKAIVILDKYKDELEKYMEEEGAATPGLLVLTTGLSKPFRRLDKYSAMLQELERHMESSHQDRGDTQRSVSVYKDIAATCSATRRQKELELQVLTGPVRGWQGQELSSLGDIIHMGSVAVGPDHRDRYFVLFPQTLLILSVSQRMSAFIYEGKLPLINICVYRLEDCDTYKNAFEITGPLIERIIAVCQGPNEANKWVHLLSSVNPTMPVGIKRQLSNLSNSSIGGSNAPALPAHMSPPASVGMPNHHHPPSVPSRPLATSVISTSHQSQHKRSLSFNHHLSYNQFTNTQHPPHLHHQQPPQSLPNHPMGATPAPSHKSNLVPTLNSISKTTPQMGISNIVGNARTGNTKANWNITNLRPAPPLRPNLLNPTSSGSSNTLSSYCSGRKMQPTFEEDALVLRVFEAYCAAYQNNVRNTIHSALQPWTPCLLIRGGKLKTSKPFSTSNPQLPFVCSQSQPPFALGSSAPSYFPPSSTNSLNSSFIWREASPNNFNLYSTSVSSLNSGGCRYSLGGAGVSNLQFSPIPADHRALSEERATRKSLNRMKSGFGSGYDNIFMTPLLPRKSKQLLKNVYHSHQRTPPTPSASASKSVTSSSKQPLLMRNHSEEQPSSTSHYPPSPGLYDRRLNRSFETASRGYGELYALKHNALQRSTPQLVADMDANDLDKTEKLSGYRGCGAGLLRNGGSNAGGCVGSMGSTASDIDSQRHSATWCCGLENEDMTPTLRQLWTAMRQMQQDMSQIKLQINEERALRVNLQQLLMQHLETASTSIISATPKC